jgi:hypothetical protein
MKDVLERMRGKDCEYTITTQDQAVLSTQAGIRLALPPFKYQKADRTAEDVGLRLKLDKNNANSIMVEGLPSEQRAVLQRHPDPYDRFKALESFFYTKGDRKAKSQFEEMLNKALKNTTKQKENMDAWLSAIFSAAELVRDVQAKGTANLSERDLVGKVTDALAEQYWKVSNRLENMLDDGNKTISWSETRSILISAERDVRAKAAVESSDSDDEQKSKPSAQVTGSDRLAEIVSVAMVTGFQQLSARNEGWGSGGWRGGKGGGGGGWHGGEGWRGGKGGGGGGWRGGGGCGRGGGGKGGGGGGGGRKCFVCGQDTHLARECPKGWHNNNN